MEFSVVVCICCTISSYNNGMARCFLRPGNTDPLRTPRPIHIANLPPPKNMFSPLMSLPLLPSLLPLFLYPRPPPQGRETCKKFWSMWVEPNAERLTTPSMMQGGRYTLIRLCKKLAQRMSKTHDSSFCGQVRENKQTTRGM